MSDTSKYHQAHKQFNPEDGANSPMPIPHMASIAWMLTIESKERKCALVALADGKIGVADLNQPGYTPTMASAGSHEEAEKACSWFNEHVLELTKEQSLELTASTFQAKQ